MFRLGEARRIESNAKQASFKLAIMESRAFLNPARKQDEISMKSRKG